MRTDPSRYQTADVFWSESRRKHLIVVALDPDEAENIGLALGHGDVGGQELIRMAHEARLLDGELA